MTETDRVRRAAAAARDVTKTATAAERTLVRDLLRRLERLRMELLAVLSRRSLTQFRRMTSAALLSDVDGLIQHAQVDLVRLAQHAYRQSVQLGDAVVTEALRAASVNVASAVSLDTRLVTTAFENTVDLLSEAMQQFRNKAAVQVRRIALEGEPTFTALRSLATDIAGKGFDSAMYRAERIIRTELSRTFNTSSYQRMLELSTEMPFIRKEWHATLDNRVRETHADAHARYGKGQGIPVPDLFRVGKGRLRHPSDPNGPAEEVVMCRCSLRTSFDLKDLRDFNVSRLRTVVPGRAA